jgi:hypothetical protein
VEALAEEEAIAEEEAVAEMRQNRKRLWRRWWPPRLEGRRRNVGS